MLKNWSIQNFKPIVDSGELKLAPVTVLAGRNSSGKSSLLQSILMIAQTLSSRLLDRALLPNGSILQLRTFEDILSEQTNSRTLVIGFTLEVENEKSKVPTRTESQSVRGTTFGSQANIESVKITSEFRSASTNGASTSAIEASKVNIEGVSLDVHTSPLLLSSKDDPLSQDKTGTRLNFNMSIKRLSPGELDKFLKGVSPEYLRHVPYTTNESNYQGTFTSQNKLDNAQLPEPSLIAFSHFLPNRLIGKYSIEERRKVQLIEILGIIFRYPGQMSSRFIIDNFSGFIDAQIVFQNNFKKAILDFCKEEGISIEFSGQTLNDLVSWYKSLGLGREQRTNSNKKLAEITAQGILEQSLELEKGTEALEALANNIYLESLTGAVEQTIRFFTSKIRYLGPLRADPQASQKFPPSSEVDDVGAKGEYAAAVYDANQDAIIQWYNPSTEVAEESTLKVALTTWVRYLGVANEIKTQEAGLSGVDWQVVHRKGSKALPLSAVGVGVSQILPILVMGLLSPNNTLLIVEQPELHLHPRVQALLGDFFMGLAKCSKQCLIETHSENLVNQLRLHIVEAGGPENADCLIYFVDQDEQGAAKFNPIEISRKGNIVNWPDGFLDETMLQEDRITAAFLKKQAKK